MMMSDNVYKIVTQTVCYRLAATIVSFRSITQVESTMTAIFIGCVAHLYRIAI